MAERPMKVLYTALVMHFFLRTSLSLSSPSGNTYFDTLQFHHLNGCIIHTAAVVGVFQCCLMCSDSTECMSLNIASRSNKDGLYECVLLRTQTSKSTGLLTQTQDYHHYTRRMVQRSQDEVSSCENGIPIGMEKGAIPDSSISASSYFSGDGKWDCSPSLSRLNMQLNERYCGAWGAAFGDNSPWLQVDLGVFTKIQAIATQGGPGDIEWVTSYTLHYSLDGCQFEDYEGGKIFPGNSDSNTIVKNDLNPVISSRYIRVRPKTWNKHPSLRMELYRCR